MTKSATDNSRYQVFTPFQYDTIARGTDGAIIRIGYGLSLDKSRLTHIEEFRRRGTPVCGYWWVDPNVDKARQIALIVETTLQLRLPSVFLDAETYWSDWAAYMRQDLATCYATRHNPEFLDKYYRDVYNGVLQGLTFHGVEVGNYSADWYIDRYAPNMRSWVFEDNYWEARYMRYYNKVALTSMINKLGIPFDVDRLDEFKEVAPIVKGIGRQFESLLYVTGLNPHQDYNFFTDEGFNRMFGTSHPTPPPPPPPPPQPVSKTYVVNTLVLRIRSGPGESYLIVGRYYTGAKVSVFEISGDWGRTDRGWIHLGYTLPIQGSYVVTATHLTIREYPFVYGKAVDWLKFGDHVFEVQRTGDWINIGRGWVSSKYLKPV